MVALGWSMHADRYRSRFELYKVPGDGFFEEEKTLTPYRGVYSIVGPSGKQIGLGFGKGDVLHTT